MVVKAHRSDSPPFSELRMTRWHRGIAEHRTNGETNYVGAPPEVEALEELADLVNYLMLMQQNWPSERLSARSSEVTTITVQVIKMYDQIREWAETDGVDMSSLWSDDSKSEDKGGG